jgi:hypothetical protein
MGLRARMPTLIFAVRHLGRTLVVVFLGGLALGVLLAVQVTRKHSEPIWFVIVGTALALTIGLAPLAFLFTIGPLWRKTRQIADLVQPYGIRASYGKGVFHYKLELPLEGPPDVFLRNSEAYVREAFAVRKLRNREDRAGFTAEVGPFISILRHRLDVSVGRRPDGKGVVRLATESVTRMPIAPPIDPGGVAMIVYLAHWMRGSPLPVMTKGSRIWKDETPMWQAVVSTIES